MHGYCGGREAGGYRWVAIFRLRREPGLGSRPRQYQHRWFTFNACPTVLYSNILSQQQSASGYASTARRDAMRTCPSGNPSDETGASRCEPKSPCGASSPATRSCPSTRTARRGCSRGSVRSSSSATRTARSRRARRSSTRSRCSGRPRSTPTRSSRAATPSSPAGTSRSSATRRTARRSAARSSSPPTSVLMPPARATPSTVAARARNRSSASPSPGRPGRTPARTSSGCWPG